MTNLHENEVLIKDNNLQFLKAYHTFHLISVFQDSGIEIHKLQKTLIVLNK